MFLFVLSGGILASLWLGVERDMGRALPLFAVGAAIILANGMRWFLPALAKDVRDLGSALRM
jgi:cell division protein FtsW (lipid II flippase)